MWMQSSAPSLRRNARTAAALVALAFVVVLSGCAGAATPAAAPSVTNAWVRLPVAAGASETAAYFTITGSSAADALTGVSTAIGSAALHQTTTATDMSGMTGMSPVDRIEVPAGTAVRLEPGGYHVMITGLKSPLTAGQKVQLTLTFEHAGTITVEAEVRAG